VFDLEVIDALPDYPRRDHERDLSPAATTNWAPGRTRDVSAKNLQPKPRHHLQDVIPVDRRLA